MFLPTISVPEAAKRKNVSEAAVRLAADNHEGLLAVRCGGRIRIIESSMQYYEPRNYRERRAEPINVPATLADVIDRTHQITYPLQEERLHS